MCYGVLETEMLLHRKFRQVNWSKSNGFVHKGERNFPEYGFNAILAHPLNLQHPFPNDGVLCLNRTGNFQRFCRLVV